MPIGLVDVFCVRADEGEGYQAGCLDLRLEVLEELWYHFLRE